MMSKQINTAAIERANVSLREMIKIFSELIKFRITILVSFTTGLGYILGAKQIGLTLIGAVAGIFLLACSSSALNHWQERDTDALMDRTRFRPIPSGRIEPGTALLISILLLISGSVVLIYTTNLTALFVGLITFIWYNALYTPLKRKTAFAIMPGAVVGALPPIAGWAAAGADIFDYRIMIVAAYMFVWQIPHFWLLLLLFGEDYQKGGFPTLNSIFNKEQIKRITFAWLSATVLVALLVPMFIYLYNIFTLPLIIMISLGMMAVSFRFLFLPLERKSIRNSFIAINFYTLLLISILSLDKLIKVF
ncbi:MAG TPA: protoheme IX farnesyltransferase [Ignavibacteria bacterium]|jgi:protoheme IX farnesyltransferase